MTERFHSTLAYAILFLTCSLGVAHQSWWAACMGACALTLLSLFGRQLKRASNTGLRDDISDMSLALSSALNGAAAASAAYLLGKASAWIWGF